MTEINKTFQNTDEAAAFINESEASFENELEAASKQILADKDLRLVTLSGPTCSGKTTTAAKLTSDLEKEGKKARVISIDDFYRDKVEPEEGKKPDFESAATIDLEYLGECVKGLFEGRMVKLPLFDFKKKMRVCTAEYVPHGNDIYIFEGIQAVYPEVTGLFTGLDYKSVFISVKDDVKVNGIYFDKNEVRLMRRLVRDYNFRAATPEYTFYLWDSVRENEETNIYPYIDKVDIKINSFLPYEIFIIGKFLLPLLDKVGDDSKYYSDICSLREKLISVGSFPADESFIPLKSVFREFIG